MGGHDDSANDRLNKLGEWVTSGHAGKLQSHMNGEHGSHYATSCLDCHTVGFDESPFAVNNGFDDIANDLSYPLSNIPDLVAEAANTGIGQFDQLPAELQDHASIQCESCHGPGSNHLGNLRNESHGVAGVNFDVGQCARCHDSPTGFQQIVYQWESSAHSTAEGRGSSSCNKCHTSEGFVDVQVDGLTPVAIPNPEHVMTCSGCHDPHNSDNEHQLRLVGEFNLPSGDLFEDAGPGGLCARCHNSRVVDVDATALGSYRGAHHGPQADMWIGKNAAGFGLAFIGNSAHTTIVEEACVECHMAEGVGGGPGQATPPLVGNHGHRR